MSLLKVECDRNRSLLCLHGSPVEVSLDPRFLATALRKALHGMFCTLVPWSSQPRGGGGRCRHKGNDCWRQRQTEGQTPVLGVWRQTSRGEVFIDAVVVG